MVKRSKKDDPAVPKAAVPRRTKTMQQLIDRNSDIIHENLGRRRSQSHPPKADKKVEKKVDKKAPLAKKAIKKAPKPAPKASPVKKAAKKKDSSSASKDSPKKVAPKKGKAAPKKDADAKVPEKAADKQPDKQAEKVEKKDAAKGPRRTESKATAGMVDAVFCCDTTGSMATYLNQTKSAVQEIVKNIKDKAQAEDISVRFGFVCYRDHPPQERTYVTKVQDLCSADEVIQFIGKQTAEGGGDEPEAVLDGLYEAAKSINWRDSRKIPSLRYIFHIADAPPHGKEFGVNSAWNNGVPSGINLEKVVHVINIREIHYRLIKVGGNLQKMAELFKEKFTNYEETDLKQAKDMNIKISDMIIRELLPDVVYDI